MYFDTMIILLLGSGVILRDIYADSSSCYDMRGDCETLQKIGYCDKESAMMQGVCGKTCGLCGKKISAKKPTEPRRKITINACKNHRTDCSLLSEAGWCQLRQSLMSQLCGPACGFCEESNENVVSVTIGARTITTRAPITQPSNCFDKRTDCHRLAHVFKWCVAKRSAMQLLCARTCNYCHRHNKKPTKATTTKLTTGTTTTKVVPTTAENTATDCTDTRDDCARLSNEFGWCVSKRSVMEKVCAVTCNACVAKKKKEITFAPPEVPATPRVPVCEDKMEGCSFIKKRGWCTRRKSAFETRCRKTCGFCAPCSDSRPDCFKYKSNGWCETKKPLMVGVCPRTCGLCSMVPAKPKGESCKDKNAGCQKMKKIGFCKSRKATMKKLCPGTCGFCTPGNGASAAVSATTTAPTAPKTTRRRVMGCSDAYGAERCNYYSHLGWCEKYDRIRKNCDDTCRCNYVAPTKLPQSQKCNETPHGCCWDKKTAKRDANGSDCPECSDDKRFTVLCARFGDDCTSSGSLAKSLHKYCPKTCKMC